MNEYINVSLVISSEKNYNDIISERLQIKPTSERDKTSFPNKDYAHCEWIYSTGDLIVRSLSEALSPIVSTFQNKKSELKKLMKEINGRCDIVIVISATSGDSHEIVLNDKIIGFANDIHAEISFDMYYYDE